MGVADGPQDVHSASEDSESEEEKLSINFDLSLPGAHSVSICMGLMKTISNDEG